MPAAGSDHSSAAGSGQVRIRNRDLDHGVAVPAGKVEDLDREARAVELLPAEYLDRGASAVEVEECGEAERPALGEEPDRILDGSGNHLAPDADGRERADLRGPARGHDKVVPLIEQELHRVQKRHRSGKIRAGKKDLLAAREQDPVARRVPAADRSRVAQQEDAGAAPREIDHLVAAVAVAAVRDDQDLPLSRRPRGEVRANRLEGPPDRTDLILHRKNDAQADAVAGHHIPAAGLCPECGDRPRFRSWTIPRFKRRLVEATAPATPFGIAQVVDCSMIC